MSIRLRRFLLLSISAITLVAFILYIRTSTRIKWFESNDPHRMVTFVTESGTGHGIHANHDDDFHYTAYIASEYSNEVTVSLKYADSVQIGDNVYHSGDKLKDISPETDLVFRVFNYPDEVLVFGSISFLFTEITPSLYIDTVSGSMAEVDSDAFHNYTESASYYAVDTDYSVSNGKCEIRGRGNTTWSGVKKPYNINCQRDVSLFGMDAQQKWCLLANCFDGSELKNWFALNLAKGINMSVYCDCEFVNLYLNGEYAGLYLLAQSIDISGGNIPVTDLGKLNNRINKYPSDASYSMVRHDHTDGSGRYISYYEGASPDDISGGYLLEFFDLPVDTPAQFATDHALINIDSPRFPTKEESLYISDFINLVEDTIYKTSGNTYMNYIDTDSWTDTYLIQEYLANEDTDRYSSYMYKDRNSDLILSGPVWDFDNGLGADRYRRRPFTVQTLWLKSRADSLSDYTNGKIRGGWLWGLFNLHKDFGDETINKYFNVMLPVLDKLLDEDMPDIHDQILSSVHMDYIRYPADICSDHVNGFEDDYEYLYEWLISRRDFLTDYYKNPNDYICATFDGLELYHCMIRNGDTIKELPIDIDGNNTWIYEETGVCLKEGDAIHSDTRFIHD